MTQMSMRMIMADAKSDRMGLSKSLRAKVATKADLTSDMEIVKGTEKSTSAE